MHSSVSQQDKKNTEPRESNRSLLTSAHVAQRTGMTTGEVYYAIASTGMSRPLMRVDNVDYWLAKDVDHWITQRDRAKGL